MLRTDLVGALKNAMDHGSDLGQAMQSLVNAGYSIPEVQEAARYIQMSKSYPQLHKSVQEQQVQQQPLQPTVQKTQTNQINMKPLAPPTYQKPKSKTNVLIIVWILVILLSLIGLGWLIYYLLFTKTDALASALGG
jgi:ABC-type Na+ efflux pump permease subunit